jgi:hypothetical protein
MGTNKGGRPSKKQLAERKKELNNFDKLYDEACDNLREDRKMTKKFLDTYRLSVSGSSDLLVAGSSIAKFIEVLTDMNRHMIDLARVKQSEYEANLFDASGEDDEKDIYDALQRPVAKQESVSPETKDEPLEDAIETSALSEEPEDMEQLDEVRGDA